MKKKVSISLMILGLILIISSAILLIFTQSQEQEATKVSHEVLVSLTVEIQNPHTDEQIQSPVIDIDGQKYIGIIIIPKLNLELPIANTCNDYLLTQTPCAYTGDISSKDLIVAAHNYRAHFANIGTLTADDEVYIMDTQGTFHAYELTLQEIVDENDVDTLNSGEWNLTLFTCLYTDDSQRVVLRFNETAMDT